MIKINEKIANNCYLEESTTAENNWMWSWMLRKKRICRRIWHSMAATGIIKADQKVVLNALEVIEKHQDKRNGNRNSDEKACWSGLQTLRFAAFRLILVAARQIYGKKNQRLYWTLGSMWISVGKGRAIFSLEKMSRVACKSSVLFGAHVDAQDTETGNLKRFSWEKQSEKVPVRSEKNQNWSLTMYGISITEKMRSKSTVKVQVKRARSGSEKIIIDYLQLMKSTC